jgi:DNA polymerase V
MYPKGIVSLRCGISNSLDPVLIPISFNLGVAAKTTDPCLLSVVLAATPKLKEIGIKTGSRLFEIPHRNDIYIINPSMRNLE